MGVCALGLGAIVVTGNGVVDLAEGRNEAVGNVDEFGADNVSLTEPKGTSDCIDFDSLEVKGCSLLNKENRSSTSGSFVDGPCMRVLAPGGGGGRKGGLGGGGSGCGNELTRGGLVVIRVVRDFIPSSASASSLALGTISDRNSMSSDDNAMDCDCEPLACEDAADERENRSRNRDTTEGWAMTSCGAFSSPTRKGPDALEVGAGDVTVVGWLMLD